MSQIKQEAPGESVSWYEFAGGLMRFFVFCAGPMRASAPTTYIMNHRRAFVNIDGKTHEVDIVTGLNLNEKDKHNYGDKFYDIKISEEPTTKTYGAVPSGAASPYKIKYVVGSSDVLSLAQKNRAVNLYRGYLILRQLLFPIIKSEYRSCRTPRVCAIIPAFGQTPSPAGAGRGLSRLHQGGCANVI